MMELFWAMVRAFVVGGALCALGELLILRTNLTSARILVLFVIAGVALGALGIYEPLIEFAGAGATTPLTGFGYSLSQGAIKGAREEGLMGALSGGIAATAAGVAASIVFGYIAALCSRPRSKD